MPIDYNFTDNVITAISSSTSTDVAFNPFPDSEEYSGHYVRMNVYADSVESVSSIQNSYLASFSSNNINPAYEGDDPLFKYELQIYKDDNDDVGSDFYLKPNEILSRGTVPTSNYLLTFDYLQDIFSSTNDLGSYYLSPDNGVNRYQNPYFLVSEISDTRREIRLKSLSDDNINPFTFDGDNGKQNADNFSELLGDPLSNDPVLSYKYDYHLEIGYGRTLQIINYLFDETSQEGYRSLILKLSTPVPPDVTTNQKVIIEQEILETQSQNIFYISEVVGDVPPGGLESEDASFIDNFQNNLNDSEYQNYNDLTSSLEDNSIVEYILSGSKDKNLNINYNEFSNHTFFGSAKRKLENFKTKVENIETYLSELSSSLSDGPPSSASISLDSEVGHLKEIRTAIFNNIKQEINTFTPYERFMYYDNQLHSSASAPGLGRNLAKTHTNTIYNLNNDGDSDTGTQLLNGTWGFNKVFKVSGSGADKSVYILKNTYRAENKPIFNYSGSVYLSFLMKGVDYIDSSSLNQGLTLTNTNNISYTTPQGVSYQVPYDAYYSSSILNPVPTGSEWRRYIFEASQSYWRPTSVPDYSTTNLIPSDFNPGSSACQILQNSNVTGSYKISVGNDYHSLATYLTQSGAPFTGSIMPAGDLFNLSYRVGATHATSSYITDVQITKNNPLDVYPFGQVYKTTTSTFKDWYDIQYASASAFDDDNIHSLWNNLPTYMNEESGHGDLKTFLSMIGEHFDLLRNYIDNYMNFHKRGYNSLESPAPTLMVNLADSLGFELVNPFSGSLAEYFGSEEDIQVGGNSIEEIKNNTWRKILNNLIYIYKSKGTLNSVRALLNCYGYPPDVLQLQELGGSLETYSTQIGENDAGIEEGLSRINNSNISFTSEKADLYGLLFTKDRKLQVNWWTNGGSITWDEKNGQNAIEFVLKQPGTPTNKAINTQEILMSSGSSGKVMWDLIQEHSASLHRLRFRLAKTSNGSTNINDQAVSMSTDYQPMNPGSLWNVLLQRMTGSLDHTITNEYQLKLAYQSGDSITKYQAVSMSLDGAVVANRFANTNFPSTGSTSSQTRYNLYIGRTFSGSLSQVRTWNEALSQSVWKEHVLNKFSGKGNSINSYKNNVVQYYPLNENYTQSGSRPEGSQFTTLRIVDASSKSPAANPVDYKVSLSTGSFQDGLLYDKTEIELYKFSPLTLGVDARNSNKVLISPKVDPLSNLDPHSDSAKNIYNEVGEVKRTYVTKIDFSKSPSTIIDSFIYDKLAGFNVFDNINVSDVYKNEYKDLNSFSQDFFDFHDFKFEVNKFIRANANINHKFAEDLIKKVIPARVSDVKGGIVIKPNALDRIKLKEPKPSVATQLPNLGIVPVEVTASGVNETLNQGLYDARLTEFGSYEDVKEDIVKDFVSIDSNKISLYSKNINSNVTESSAKQAYNTITFDVLPDETSVKQLIREDVVDSLPITSPENLPFYENKLNINIVKKGIYDSVKSKTINVNLTESANFETVKDVTISDLVTENSSYELSRDKSISALPVSSSEKLPLYEDIYDVYNQLVQEYTYESIYSDTLNIVDSGSKNAYVSIENEYSSPYSATTSSLPTLGLSKKLTFNKKDVDSTPDVIGNSLTFNKKYVDSTPDIIGSNSVYSTGSIDIVTTTAEKMYFLTASDNFVNEGGFKSYENLMDKWGRDGSDIHFIPLVKHDAKSFDSDGRATRRTNADDTKNLYTYSNIGIYKTDVSFFAIGDFEQISSSIDRNLGGYPIIYENNEKYFKYRQQAVGWRAMSVQDKNKQVTYDTYYTGDGNIKSTRVGRPIGKTAFFATASDGQAVYPSNHWTNFTNEFTERMSTGTQNINPGYWPNSEIDDLSTASFYSVLTTDESSRGRITDRGFLNTSARGKIDTTKGGTIVGRGKNKRGGGKR